MVVYADILITLNLIIDYFLLLLTARIIHRRPPLWRILTASVLSALTSLYIFFPKTSSIIEMLINIAICSVTAFICFGYGGIKQLLRSIAVFFGVSCFYAGGMLAFWYLFKPNGMVINNSVVYFNISPVFLIGFSVIGYFISFFLNKFLSKNAESATECTIRVTADGKHTDINGIIDTGNSIEDVFGNSEVIITDKKYAEYLFGDKLYTERIKSRYRLLPCKTISGGGLLEGYRCDKAYITCNEKTTVLSKPILAVSKESLGGDYGAIVNPRIIK